MKLSLGPRKAAHAALYLALAIILPVVFHQFGIGGRVFLPMHIPVLICGFVVGPLAGVLIGLVAPPMSQLLTGMPPLYAVPLMMMELALYGLIAGLAYRKMGFNIYIALLIAMIFGRLAFALGLLVLGQFQGIKLALWADAVSDGRNYRRRFAGNNFAIGDNTSRSRRHQADGKILIPLTQKSKKINSIPVGIVDRCAMWDDRCRRRNERPRVLRSF